jgi:hypothetical protein
VSTFDQGYLPLRAETDLSIHECRLCRWADIRDETVSHHTMLIDMPSEHGWIATDTLVEVTQ